MTLSKGISYLKTLIGLSNFLINSIPSFLNLVITASLSILSNISKDCVVKTL